MLDTRSGFVLMSVMGLTLTSWTLNDGVDYRGPRDEKQTVILTGDAERPDKVRTEAKGTGVFVWDDHGGITFTLRVENLSSKPTAVHIHGPADKDGTGPVLASLEIKDSLTTGVIASGTIGASIFAHFQRDALKDLFDDGKAYVHVHSVNYPDGEIRGQFRK
jgi:hypothetical protein